MTVRLPDDRPRRRRLAVLALLAGAAGLGGAWAGAQEGDEPLRAERPAERPRAAGRDRPATFGPGTALRDPTAGSRQGGASDAQLTREAGQTIVLRFRGTSAPPYVLRALRERRVAGVILFRDNMSTPGALRRMTRAFQRAGRGRALVMTDQEGGAIRNVPFAAAGAPPTRVATPAAATAAARTTARGLLGFGVNVNLAPVADVGAWPGSVMRTRAFPGSAAAVAPLVAASVRGHAREGVLATAKHFPGFGRSTTNTDFAPATVAGAGDLAPFAAAVRAQVPLVMVSHALHPAIDRGRIASQSSRVLRGLLRERLGFRGACITDSLEAKAVVRRTSTPVAAARSMRAGCDLMLTTGRGSYINVLRRFVSESRNDPAFRSRMAEARERIAVLHDAVDGAR